jgi:hypothetical protein
MVCELGSVELLFPLMCFGADKKGNIFHTNDTKPLYFILSMIAKERLFSPMQNHSLDREIAILRFVPHQ